MAKKARQRISYVLELENSSRGHRLGVNGLAVDRENGVLYSGGRDGVICAWDLGQELFSRPASGDAKYPLTSFKAQTLAHTHWINDICLAANNSAVVSASSDMMVKVWRPNSTEEGAEPTTIGQHADYAKCVSSPGSASDWVASGGLDRKICLWDLNGAGPKLEIDVRGESVAEKGSVYTLACSSSSSVIVSGSPESTVRLWDARTGKEVTKFVGHTDVIRSVLVSDSGDTILSASSDSTIKLWSVTAGRCMYTFSMHSQSVWSLFSEDPRLSIFYSGDRSGLVAKTDMKGSLDEIDDGVSLAVARESGGENGGGGILKLVAGGDHIWTATSSSSINKWSNIDVDNVSLPETWRHHRHHRHGSLTSRYRHSSIPSIASSGSQHTKAKKDIPTKSFLRLSNTASFPPPLVTRDSDTNTIASVGTRRQASEMPDTLIEPIHHLPEETIEGQCGLLKCKLLNDRRRVLTVDTVGEVVLWDVIRCQPIRNFGKRAIEEIEPEVNTLEAVAPWCSVDVSNGNLTVVLDPFNCFDAEIYADELVVSEPVEFREDQRINLGKWILRYLFDKLIDEEVKRDEAYRARLNEHVERRLARNRTNAPSSIDLPPLDVATLHTESSMTTPRANGIHAATPGLGIALATPAPLVGIGIRPDNAGGPASPATTKTPLLGQASGEKEDYFSTPIMQADAPKLTATSTTAPETPVEKPDDTKERDATNGKSPSTPFGRFRMFGAAKKFGRSASTNTDKPALTEDQKAAAAATTASAGEGDQSESSSHHEKEVDDCFLGAVQRARNRYDWQLTEHPDRYIETCLCPSLPSETPFLRLPPGLKIIIQEETSGGSVEVYKGTIESTGDDTDTVETKGPLWLGDALLLNRLPMKEPVKISFVLHPWHNTLPSISTPDGNDRLNANRMLRVKRILAYVAERIDPQDPESMNSGALKPEEYLELYCNDQLLPINMSLATLRAHIWKGGSDIMLYYKANGRKEIPIPPPQTPPAPGNSTEHSEESEMTTGAAGSAPVAHPETQ